MIKEAQQAQHSLAAKPVEHSGTQYEVETFIQRVQQLMWNKVGIVRSRQSLTEAIQQLQASAPAVATTNLTSQLRGKKYSYDSAADCAFRAGPAGKPRSALPHRLS